MAKIYNHFMTGLTRVKVFKCENKKCGVSFSYPETLIQSAKQHGRNVHQEDIHCVKCGAIQERFYNDT